MTDIKTFQPLLYREKLEYKEARQDEVTFTLSGLERGFGNTLGVALRRVLLSNITTLAPFCVKISGVQHEFGAINGVIQDVPSIIMNLRQVRFTYDPQFVAADEIIKVKLRVSNVGKVTSKLIEVETPGVNVVDENIFIAETVKENVLRIEMYLRVGRGFIPFSENKDFINDPEILIKLSDLSDIASKNQAEFIAVDSDFSPIKKAKYETIDLNTSSAKIEEELEFSLQTDGSVSAKEAIRQASKILIGMFQVIGDVDNMQEVKIFEEEKKEEVQPIDDDLDISLLGLSVRSLNALRKIGKRKISQVAELTLEQLEGTKNLGRKSIDEIIEKLREHGYELAQGEEEK